LSKRTRRRIKAGIKRGADKPKATRAEQGFASAPKRIPDESKFPSAVASYHFLTDPELQAAKEIAEYWIAHWDGVIWWENSDEQVDLTTEELRGAVAAVVVEASLTQRQLQVMDLRNEGSSWGAIADALGLRVSTVRNHMSRGVSKLRYALGERI
jgi:DNA-binding CsgD family transcriptional regulator